MITSNREVIGAGIIDYLIDHYQKSVFYQGNGCNFFDYLEIVQKTDR